MEPARFTSTAVLSLQFTVKLFYEFMLVEIINQMTSFSPGKIHLWTKKYIGFKQSWTHTHTHTHTHRSTLNKDITCFDCQIHINISYLPHYLSTSFIIYERYLVCHGVHAEDFFVFICLLWVCHLDNVTVGHKLLWYLCNAGIQPSTRLFYVNKQASPLLNTRPLIIHIELNGTLFIRLRHQGTSCSELYTYTYLCLCVCVYYEKARRRVKNILN